ncbi:hypothetical protein ACCO45_010782 [Purpureocillium lilacinum]|uniref:Uncharacterized protein n=1 Tax=Purpureocillium lilacinum TaxID=33203 RepID=A0ACC4DG10_PURLI
MAGSQSCEASRPAKQGTYCLTAPADPPNPPGARLFQRPVLPPPLFLETPSGPLRYSPFSSLRATSCNFSPPPRALSVHHLHSALAQTCVMDGDGAGAGAGHGNRGAGRSSSSRDHHDAHRTHRRGPWTTAEDNELLRLIDLSGPNNWVEISNNMQGRRTAKQCRERWSQNLDPKLNHAPITPKEGELIREWVEKEGTKWAEFSRRLPGRSDNAIKNWYNGSHNREKKRLAGRTASAAAEVELAPPSAMQRLQPPQLPHGPSNTYILPPPRGLYPDNSIPRSAFAPSPRPAASTAMMERPSMTFTQRQPSLVADGYASPRSAFPSGRPSMLSPHEAELEADAGAANYVMSQRYNTQEHSRLRVALPPLQDWPPEDQDGVRNVPRTPLPGVHCLTFTSSRSGAAMPSRRLSPPSRPDEAQLPTAPGSPAYGQEHGAQSYARIPREGPVPQAPQRPEQQQQRVDESKSVKDPRMHLSKVLS